MNRDILEVSDLQTYFYTYEGVVEALSGVNLSVGKGEVVGVAGETGCGKTVTMLSIMRLIRPPGKIVGGSIIFKGEDLLKKSEEEMRKIRGGKIAMIFQEPMTSLNPVFTIGEQISSVIRLHRGLKKNEAKKEAAETLRKVRIPSPDEALHRYPHELSGGMRQRAMIAMAISCKPELIIADEPTSFLDVSVQAQVLHEIKELQKNLGVSMILISHDLGILSQTCDRIVIMYAGHISEEADVLEIIENPRHPYVFGLLNCIPQLEKTPKRLHTIKGLVPRLINPPPGCRFHLRCPYATDICKNKFPPKTEVSKGHSIYCWNWRKVER